MSKIKSLEEALRIYKVDAKQDSKKIKRYHSMKKLVEGINYFLTFPKSSCPELSSFLKVAKEEN